MHFNAPKYWVYLSVTALLLGWMSCRAPQESSPVPAIVEETLPPMDSTVTSLMVDTIAPLFLSELPEGFIDLQEFIPALKIDLRYYSTDNFVGDTVNGYLADRAILSIEAAHALQRVQFDLEAIGMGLLLYDAYRPQRAVDHFRAWARVPADTLTKRIYYPNLHKSQVFAQGYVARQSSHSRGSAVDVTLVRSQGDSLNHIVDMGSPWDLFDSISHTKSPLVTELQSANRELLRLHMVKQGFSSLPHEWWHFRLRNEPYPETYFDFEIK